MTVLQKVLRTIKTEIWWTVTVLLMVTMVANVTSLNGPHVCMVKQKYNITKRVKYRAPMSVRTYEWCFAMPPRCSKWNTEMRDVTRLETEERTAEMAVCCPGYKLRDVSCVPHCPSGKTGHGCSEDCPPNKWGPSCVHDCKICDHGSCDAVTGACHCQDGWQGESCETSMTTTATAAMMEQLLTTESTSNKAISEIIPTRSIAITSTAAATFATSKDTASATNLTSITTGFLASKETTPTTIVTLPTTVVTSPIVKNIEGTSPTLSASKSSTVSNDLPIATVLISTFNTRVIESEEITKKSETPASNHSSYNRTEVPIKTDKTKLPVKKNATTEPLLVKSDLEWTTLMPADISTTANSFIPVYQSNTTIATALTTTTPINSSRKIHTTVRQPMATKSKAKEIWIKPAQKGESPITEAKLKPNQEIPHSKLKHKEMIEITTPKTIIVSIIPTSVTYYVTFKKIALTTVSLMAQSSNISTANSNNKRTENESTIPEIVSTTSLPTTLNVLTKNIYMSPSTNSSMWYQNVTKPNSFIPTTKRSFVTTMPTTQTTNSMLSTLNVSNKRLNSSLLTSVSSFLLNVTKPRRKQHSLFDSTTSKTITSAHFNHRISQVTESTTEQLTLPTRSLTVVQKNVTNRVTELRHTTETFIHKNENNKSNKRNVTNSLTTTIANTVTDGPTIDEETFHILTEPEHITAVMGDKGNEKSTINLISVISIAGGVMMAVITVAIIIVMLERCKKPRYEDVRKYNDIRMQVMIDNNDIPPPYVRSIFHTPLPDPPTSEKCHYQPISTLDRNLKQFMRPVVVQTISPLMLENFRGILECHYDHLPRRSQNIMEGMGTMQIRCSVAPSIDENEELLPPPRIHSLTDSDIEAMKCEAKLDVIDNTTSEPLYAEIPCWRPPSAHAIEVVNLNGEAVTEL